MKQRLALSWSSRLFIVLASVYALLAFVLPASTVTKETLHITDGQYLALILAIRLPIIAIWCLAFYAFRQMHAYAQVVKEAPEGSHFITITKGLRWIVWGMLIPALIASVLNAIANENTDFLRIALIVTNYMYVIVTLFAFSFISAGVHRFARHAHAQLTTAHLRLLVLGLVTLGVIFTYLIGARLHGSALTDSYNAYYLPNFLVWFTIVVPYLYAWFLGIFAALELMIVAKNTPGVIYKHALQYVATGLVILILALCFMQYYRAVVPRTGYLTVGVTLIMTYLIYIFAAAGSIILAIGARKLKRIEEI